MAAAAEAWSEPLALLLSVLVLRARVSVGVYDVPPIAPRLSEPPPASPAEAEAPDAPDVPPPERVAPPLPPPPYEWSCPEEVV